MILAQTYYLKKIDMRQMMNILMTLATLVVALLSQSCEKMSTGTAEMQNKVDMTVKKVTIRDTITVTEIVIQKDTIILPGDTIISVVEKEVIKYITVHDTVTVENNFTGHRTGSPLVTGKRVATLPEFTFVDGKLVETNYLTANFKFEVKASNPIEVPSEPTLVSTSATISGKNFSYKYYAGENVNDSWKVTSDNRVAFQTQNGIQYYTIPEYTPVSLAFYNASDKKWEHLAAATINNIIQDSDIQELYIKAKDEPKPEYKLIINHKSAKVNASAMQIVDTHNAYLVDNDKVVETDTYDALHQVSFTQSAQVEYNVAKEMEQASFTITNGMVKVNNIIFKVSVKTADCDAVTMDTNNTTYCHPAFPVDGAVKALNCCSLEGKTLKTKTITDNELPGEIIIGDNDEDTVTIPIVIEVVPPTTPADVHDVEFAEEALVTSPNFLTLIAYPTINGVRTGEEVELKDSFSGSLTAGAQINKTSKGSVTLNSTTAMISDNNAIFTYIIESETTDGIWKWSIKNEGTFTYKRNGVNKTVTRPIKADVAVKSTSFTADNGTYRNTASLYANGFAIDADTQVIKITPPTVRRDSTYSAGTPYSATKAKVIRTVYANGQFESTKDIYVDYVVDFDCGAKETIPNMSQLNYGSAISAKVGSNPIALNIHRFNAIVDVPSKLNFVDDGKSHTVDFTYSTLVIESNGNITKTDNSTSEYQIINNKLYFKLVCDGFTVATDTKEIVQKKEIPSIKPLIDGYTAIEAYITNCFHTEGTTQISDGAHMAIVFKKNIEGYSGNDKYIIRHADPVTAKQIGKDTYFSSIDETQIISFITVNNTMEPAYLIDYKNGNWLYQSIANSAMVYPIALPETITQRFDFTVIKSNKHDGYITIKYKEITHKLN